MKYAAWVLLCWATWIAPAAAQQPGEPAKLLTPSDAVTLAAADLSQISPEEQPFQRYFFTLDNSKEFFGAFSYVVNATLSHATTLYQPARVGNGYLIRVDLRRLWPRAAVYEKLFPEFEKLSQLDPFFHTVGEIELVKEEEVRVNVTPYKAKDGKTYDFEFQTQKVVTKLTGADHSLHLLGPNENRDSLAALTVGTQSVSPILRADWFIVKMSSTTNGGQYYKFRLVDASPSGTTAEKAWLKQLGADLDLVAELRSDQRVAKWRSNVTGKPRSIEYFYGVGTRASLGPSLITLTRDYFDGRIDPKRHPILNLLEREFDGVEAIGVLPNGLPTWAIFEGDGSLANVAPPNLVTDRTVPAPHTTGLQPPISCWRCHAPKDGWMDANNDVAAFTKGNFGINIFDDEKSQEDPTSTLDRLAGLYSGDIMEPIRIARNTHAKATFIVTGGMEIPATLGKIAEIYNQYVYDPITPQVACRELGWQVTEDKAAAFFSEVLPPLATNAAGVLPETITVGTIRAWTAENQLVVNRDDWEQAFPDAMLRVTTESVRKTIAQEGQK